MQIAFDYRPAQSRYAGHGIGTFVRNLSKNLARIISKESVVFFGTAPEGPGIGKYHRLPSASSYPWLSEQIILPFHIGMGTFDLYHSTVSLGPLTEIGLPYMQPRPTVATVYDLHAFESPELRHIARSKSFAVQKRAIRKARAVVSLSKYVCGRVCSALGVEDYRTVVIPCAVDEEIQHAHKMSAIREKPSRTYILGMGETANKNLLAVLKAFEILAERGFDGDCVVVGDRERQTNEVAVLLGESRWSGRVRFTGRINTAELVRLYQDCAVFLFPSVREGFGFPVIEAMQCGAPVVSSNTTSLPEAGGDAAMYVAPGDYEAIADATAGIMENRSLREELIHAGHRRVDGMSWSKTVEALHEVYTRVVEKKY